jgi:hypothetical protein
MPQLRTANMARLFSRFASAAALISAFSMAATPAFATPLPVMSRPLAPAPLAWQGWKAGDEIANHRGSPYYRHRRGGLDTGDVIAGVLVLGGIAAIASAASNSNKRQREAEGYPDYRDGDYRGSDYRGSDDYPYRDRPYDGGNSGAARYSSSHGMDNAADMCVREVERRAPVDNVEGVSRSAEGWRVDGVLRNGREFSCQIGNDGRIGDVQLDAGADQSSSDNRQWQDQDYARAREQSADRYDDRDDGRYRTADVPDFSGS